MYSPNPEPPVQEPQVEPKPKPNTLYVITQAITHLEGEDLKSLITIFIAQFKQQQKIEVMPQLSGSNHEQVPYLGGKVGAVRVCEESGTDSDALAHHQLNPKPNPTSTPHTHNQPTLQLPEASVNPGNVSVSYPELQTSLPCNIKCTIKSTLKKILSNE